MCRMMRPTAALVMSKQGWDCEYRGVSAFCVCVCGETLVMHLSICLSDHVRMRVHVFAFA